jgi:hypothetical protein
MKKTGVEWLVQQICGDHTEQWQKEIEQAKKMEKQQIVDAYVYGSAYGIDFNKGLNPMNYYKETYESNT